MPKSRPRSPIGNLPTPISAFIGRGREIAEVKRLLGSHRLVTVTGPGGSGKTRLALEVAKGLQGEYEDGVWLAELAPLSDGELIPQIVAASMSLRSQAGRLPIEALVAHLLSRHTLLVIDNCEHLIDACTNFVHTLLERCPNLHVLATSRQTLAISGESIWSIPPLTLPERLPRKGQSGEQDALRLLQRSEAVQLFVDRATSAAPDFVLNTDNAVLVAEICQRLDGLPLAIELAATRVRTLSVAQIAKRLDDRFHLLTEGNRTENPRQQTLKATLDWSYELLPEDERKLFMQLSAFAGGATLSAVEAVCAGDGVESAQVLDLLSHLVQKSLLTVSRPAAEERRYGLLETIGEYACEKLKDSGGMSVVHDRFLQYYLRLVEEASVQLRGPEEKIWYQRLEHEHDNIRAAFGWALETRKVDEGIRLACGLHSFWFTHGYLNEGVGWLERALEFRQLASKSSLANALKTLSGLLMYSRGRDLSQIGTLLEESLHLYRQLEDKEGIAWVLNLMGIRALEQEQYAKAKQFLNESLSLRRGLGDPWFIAQTLQNFAPIYLHERDYASAEKFAGETIVWFERAENKRGVARTLLDLAEIARRQGDTGRALALLTQSLLQLAQLGDKSSSASSLIAIAELEAERGNHKRAAKLLGAAEALGEAFDMALTSNPERRQHEETLAAVRETLHEAALTEAMEQGRALKPDDLVEFVLHRSEAPAAIRPQDERWAGLTARERETALLIAQGKSNRDIAEKMTVSMKTVESNVTRILRKLHFDSRVQVATWIIENDMR